MPEIILPIVFCIALLILKMIHKQYLFALSARIAMAVMLVVTAIAHVIFAEGMSMMLPDFIPYKIELVYFTGIIEAAAAGGLLIPSYRKLTAWLLIVFFLLILPANIYAAIEHVNIESAAFDGDGPSYLWYRIPVQVFFIAWVYFSCIRPIADKKGLDMKRTHKRRLRTRWLELYERIPYELLLLADETIEAINRYVRDGDIYVLERGGKLIAAYVLYALNEHEVEIKNIAVDRTYQGQGIGRFLLQDAAVRAAERGYSSLLIGTAETAVKQLALYRKAGFSFHAIKEDFFTTNYPVPIVEDGMPLKHMVMLRKKLK